jgi:spermidine synthase
LTAEKAPGEAAGEPAPTGDPRAPRAFRPWVAGGLVYVSSAVVLVLEIVALRLVAPYVGLTLETNTAVIGTALAAIAVGAWTGGRLADRVDPRRLLAPMLVTGGALTMLTLPAVRFAGEGLRGGDQLSVLALAQVAVFVPAALLSAVTPMVVKLQLADLGRTGSVVGRLSGIGTLGAITATFVTGFVLVAALPTSVILLVAGAAVGLVGLALGTAETMAGRRPQGRRTIVLLLALPFGSGLVLAAPNPCAIETAYHCAQVVPDPARSDGRVLELDTLRHSYVDLSDPTHLEFEYVQAIASLADVLAPARQPLDALHLGGGGLTLPRYLAATRPGSRSLVLEVDAGVVRLDRSRLALRTGPDLRVDVTDARIGLAGAPAGSRDLVVGDAFGGIAVPWHLTTKETVADVRRVLRPGGVYAVNVIDFPPNHLAQAELATLRSVFDHVAVAAAPKALAGKEGGNFVLLGSDRPLPLGALAARIRQRATPWVVGSGAQTDRFDEDAPVLTDDYAPADQLLTTVA